jgi:predicted metal-dependent hydrolase
MGATAGAAFPDGFVAGVAHFNAGEFFEAHEAFEALLDAVESDARWDLLVALIQVAVGYHKGRAAHPGCERMLRLGATKLCAFDAHAFGVDVAALRGRVAEDLAALARGEAMAARLVADPPRLRLVATDSG